ncbi:Rpn family recombination-promoting nuclease/putative transposase [Caldibacillus thermoamylovorans]|uniref:Rpn family recombination-promoting nuclease/putative transposase n=1 Tax=Caldibacillus thermoamylovorans TaxID=35841 RepID=UPI00203BFA74|nr:Rpn family recombination-promoting nuclease/putative transposase [Caldibacillus thermoamylovorans]MCM3798745.1 Rpn family recombination-promoting nuclease/putative transposase [Caldibacillus thermoamylovorans]
MKIQNPHDRFFRESMGNVTTAKDFLTHYLPKNVLQIIDLNTLEPQKDSFINQELEEGFSDLLFKVDISGFSDEEIKGKVQTRILLTLLRDIFTKDIDELIHSILKCIHYLLELEDKQTGIEFLETMIRYVFSAAKYLTKDDMNKIRREIETTFPEGSEVTMTLADILREEGMKKGWEEGLEKGIEKGIELGQAKALSKTALQLLTAKFGVLPKELTEEISKLDVIKLELIISNIFNYNHLDDVKKIIS